ncbi:hypothetical protein ABZP36_002463 [Zizania latifolia]
MKPLLLTPAARLAAAPSTLSRMLHLQSGRHHAHASFSNRLSLPLLLGSRRSFRRGRFFASSSSQMAAPADAPGGSADAFEVIRAHQAKSARLPPVEEIRTILDQSVRGVLATHSQEHVGYPSGSMVDFACDQDGSPILAVSSLAIHSKNLSGNSTCSLLVAKDPEDRTDTVITVYGDATPVSDQEKDAVRSAYLRRHPEAFWVDFGDFRFLHIKPKAVRYVSGVATAILGSGEFSAAEFKEAKVDPISQFSTPITSHMNKDHADDTKLIVQHSTTVKVDFAYMLDVDSLGFNVKAGYDGSVLKLRIPFPRRAQDRKDVKTLIVEMLQAARASFRIGGYVQNWTATISRGPISYLLPSSSPILQAAPLSGTKLHCHTRRVLLYRSRTRPHRSASVTGVVPHRFPPSRGSDRNRNRNRNRNRGESRSREGEMEYRRVKDQESYDAVSQKDIESPVERSLSSGAAISSLSTAGGSKGNNSWKLKSIVTLALTLLTSSQAILIVWSKRAGKYEYSVTTANFSVEALKCLLSLIALYRTWNNQGVTEDNKLSTSFDEVSVYPIPAILYMVKNLLQYYIFAYIDAPAYQILKNLNIISTGVLYRIILKKKLSEIQWAAFILLCAGCTTAQLNPSSDHVLQTPIQGWMMAIVMALLSGFAGVYTEAIIKKRPSRNINVQNFWLYIFGMLFNLVAICVQDFDAVMNKGFFHGYSFITILMILNHALSGIAVSMVMKYADNIVKVYSTSVAMLLTAVVSVFLFGFHLSLAFFLGSTEVLAY